MKNTLKTLVINGCILFLFGHPQFLSAQTTNTQTSEAHIVFVTGYSTPAWRKEIKEVEFTDILMIEVIKWLRTEFPDVNFVSDPEAENVTINVKLRSVTLDDIITALRIASKDELTVHPIDEKMVAFYHNPLFDKNDKKTVRAFSLAGYLFGRSPEDADKAIKQLYEALNMSWEMLNRANSEPKAQRPNLSLHAPTKMLIVAGTEEQLRVVEQLIEQLDRHEIARTMDNASNANSTSTNKATRTK